MIRKIARSLVTLVFSALPAILSAQNIATFVGTGATTFAGDGGPSTAANINNPFAVVADNGGNVFVGDYFNNRLRLVDPSGVIRTIAGTGTHGRSGDGGQATAATIGYIKGLALDAAGNVYFSDDYDVVRKVNMSTGIITRIAGTGSGGYNADGIQATTAQLYIPVGLAIDLSGNLLIADQGNNRIRKVDMSSGIITTICGNGTMGGTGDGGPATAAMVNVPTGVAVSYTGVIYIADYGSNRVRKINTAGNISSITYAGSGTSYGYSGDGGPSTAAHVYYPYSVTTDSLGNVYISDQNNNVIRRINTFGTIFTMVGSGYLAGTGSGAFGGDGGPSTNAWLNQPTSCAVVPALGKVYIADKGNNRIRVVSTLHNPSFSNGHRQSITICQGRSFVNLDTLLAVDDVDTGQTEIWSLVAPALHGAVATGYSTRSTGATMLASGTTYNPFPSYFGLDSFMVRVWDGYFYDTTTIIVDILPTEAYAIAGKDTLCPHDTATFSNVVPGGSWTSTNTSVAIISSGGLVTALVPGNDTIKYTYSNICGTVTSWKALLVNSYAACHTGASSVVHGSGDVLSVYPNPNSGSFDILVSSNVDADVRLVVTDALGREVMAQAISANASQAVKFDHPAGIYFVTAYGRSGRIGSRMIAKL